MQLVLFILFLLAPLDGPDDRQTGAQPVDRCDDTAQVITPALKRSLLEAREAVWRGYFTNNREALDKLIPEDTLVMNPSSTRLGNRASVLEGAAQFSKSGAKLTRLEFPSTEVQYYGNTAIIYSTYLYELEKDGKLAPYSGRVTEVFVLRKGQWVNPGWHMDSVK